MSSERRYPRSRLITSSLIHSHAVPRSPYRITSRNTPEDRMYRRRPNSSSGGSPKRTEGSSAYTLSEHLQFRPFQFPVNGSQFNSGDRHRQNQAGIRCYQRDHSLQFSQGSWCSVNPHCLNSRQLPTILHGFLTPTL